MHLINALLTTFIKLPVITIKYVIKEPNYEVLQENKTHIREVHLLYAKGGSRYYLRENLKYFEPLKEGPSESFKYTKGDGAETLRWDKLWRWEIL